MEFWEKFLNCAINKGVGEEHAKWYVNWGVRFARSIRGVPLKERSLEDVRLFLDDLGEREDIGPWQVEQARKALRMLYEEHLGIDPKSMPKTRKGKRKDRIERPSEMQNMHGKLLEELENQLSEGHYSPRTKESYISWAKRFIAFHKMQSPSKMDAEHIKAFLKYLAIERRVSSSTQNQALNAIVFLFSRVLKREPGDFSDFVRAKMPLKKPESLSKKEVLGLIDALKEPYQIMALLMYGSGLRIMECLSLQIRDIDFDRGLIHVREGKGAKDRYVMLPAEAVKSLKIQMKLAKKTWEEDRAYDDSVEPGCQFVFPSTELKIDVKSRRVYRAHRNHNGVRKAFEAAGRAVGLRCRVTPHLLRHTFATHLYEDGWHIQTIQDLLGHAHMSTTMIYTHPMNHPGKKVISPLDTLGEDVNR